MSVWLLQPGTVGVSATSLVEQQLKVLETLNTSTFIVRKVRLVSASLKPHAHTQGFWFRCIPDVIVLFLLNIPPFNYSFMQIKALIMTQLFVCC